MKKIILFTLFLIGYLSVNAQYTEIINSKRPGFSESPYGVGTKVFQVETGAFYQSLNGENSDFTNKTLGSNLFLRYGRFLEKLEINLDVAYQKDKLSTQAIPNPIESKISGLSKLTLGAKYLIYNAKYTDKSKEIKSWKKRTAFDMKRLIPSVGVYAGWNSNFLSNDYKASGMSIKGAVLLQNDITDRFVVLTNLIVDDILLEDLKYSYIATATYALSGKWSIFGEHQGVFKKERDNEFQFGVGTAFLVNNNIQVDVSGRTTMIGDGGFANYVSLGGSWRLDKHADKKKSEALEGTKEPFFKRIFKKKKKKRRVKKVKTKKRRKSKKSKRGTPSFFKKKKKKRRR